ncbi:MAG: hypothetical protein AAFU65_09735, partial [Pseudomonadota bacterium]
MRARWCVPVVALAALSGCGTFDAIEDRPMLVARGEIQVNGNDRWNRIPRQSGQIEKEERWTRNGPLLDIITFIGQLPEGEDLARYRRREERRIPVFRADMTPPELL